MTPYNRAREVGGLVHACRLPGKRRACILTLNQRERLIEQGVTITVQPIWEWLLQKSASNDKT